MNRLIQDLPDVAVLESGQLTIEPARLAARDLMVGAVEMQKPLAASSSGSSFESPWTATFPISGVIRTDSFKCSRT